MKKVGSLRGAELPISSPLAILRRRRKLSQHAMAKRVLLVPDEELKRLATA